MSHVPAERVRGANDAPVRRDGEHVLVWTTAFRRTSWNFTLDRAVVWATELHRPVLVLDENKADDDECEAVPHGGSSWLPRRLALE